MDLSHVFLLVWICHYRFSFSRDIDVLNHMPIVPILLIKLLNFKALVLCSLKLHRINFNFIYLYETLTREVDYENTVMLIYSYLIRAFARISLALPWNQRGKLIRNIPISLIDSTVNNLNQSLFVSGLTSLRQQEEEMLLFFTIFTMFNIFSIN